MGRLLTSIIVAVVFLFVGALGFYYIQEGSFEGAGARMDDTLVDVANNTEEAAREAGDATQAFVDDLRDDDVE